MKAMKLLAVVLTICMAFSCIAVIPFTAATVASADGETTATATTTAIYVGPSTRYAGNVPSGIFLPLEKSSKYGDDTIVEITADVKMLSGTKPYVQMMRTATSSSTGTVSSSAGSVVFYQADSNNGTTNKNWQDNNTSRIDENGVFHCYVRLDDIPGEGNCFYSSVWDGGTEYRKTDIPGRGTPIGCGVFIGNTVLNDDMSVYGSYHDLSMEFLIKDIHIRITTLSGGSGGAVGDDLAPATTTLNEGEVFYFVGDSKQGNRPDAKNHPLNGRLDKWNIVSSDEDTVRQVTVADDTFDGGSHTYTQHAETDYDYEYYTCADFGNDVKFEKIGNCYSRYLDDDSAKKAFIIKSHAGDSKELTSNQGSSAIANIFVPINIHKFYSAYNADTCGANDLREDGTAVRFGVSFKAKRISGTGQPVVGVAYADGNANGASGTSYKDAEFGAPREYGKDRSYNNGLEKSGARSKQSDWVSSSYNASTGEFTALLSTESGYYKQMSRNGKTAYISIGLAEHLNSSLESLNTDSTFVISDIKFTVYGLNNSSTVKFSGANQAPKMTKANCDVETPYQYTQLWDYNEKVNGLINVGVRHAPINKYSVDGAVQNVFLTDKNQCNSSGCTLTKHAATDTTIEYYECATHGNRFEDEFASIPVDEISATKQMVVIKQAGEKVRGAFIPLDNDGWVGYKSFIFKCKMKIFGDELPIITRYRSGYWGGVGTFYEEGFTAQDAKGSQDAKGDAVTQWVDYDPETMTYTAAFSMWRADPKGYNQFKYYESDTGAHSAIMLSNFIPTSGKNPGVTTRRSATGFAFTDPEIYEAADAAAGTYTGSNLCAPISSYTANNQSYAYANCTQLNGSGEWTDRNNNTIMTAPLNKWSKYGTDSYVSFSDIPDGFFSNENTPKMVMFSGTGSNYNAIAKETFLSKGQPYQLDFDYRVFGGNGRIQVQYATSSGYSNIDPEEEGNGYTDDHEEGAHYSLRFVMPEDARINYDGNFKIYIGQADANGRTKKATTVYVANFSLVRLDKGGDAIGYNSFPNGGFYFGSAKTSITPANFDTVMFGWDPNMVNDQPTITSYKARYLYDIPEGFFEGDNIGTTADGQGGDDLALRFVGGAHANYRFDCDLPAGEGTYELSFNYRGKDDDIKLVELQGPDSSAYCTMVDSGTRVENGKFTRKYTITTTAGFRLFGDGDANGRFLFNVGDYSGGKEFYIANVSLRKKVNGTLVGPNLVGDLNPILTSDIYPVTRNNFTIADDNNSSSTKVVGHGWQASGTPTQGSVCSVDKVSDTFFNHYTTAQRLTYMTNLLLNKSVGYNPYSDTTNPYYAPINGSNMTILDLVKIKKDACTADDEGGAGVEANALKTAIMNSGNKFTATGTSVTITTTSYDTASSQVSGKDTIYISNAASGTALIGAMNSAKAGATILLERGGSWRVPANYENGISLKNNVKVGTYGSGAKPEIRGSGNNYGGASNSGLWTNDGGNIWKVKPSGSATVHDTMMPGLVYFFNNANDAAPAFAGNHDKNARAAGANNVAFNTKGELTEEGDVYYPASSEDYRDDGGYLYVYCSQNPATKYGRIEIGLKRPVINVGSGCQIDGIAVKYAGGHGINAYQKNDVTITNCEVGYVGGAPNGNVPLGNGIQFGDGGSNLTVDHCYVYHCFDAGITFQSYTNVATTFSNVNFTNNLLTNNAYNIEFFTTGTSAYKEGSSKTYNGTISNVNISGNIMRFAGETYSWNQRYDYLRIANICVTKNAWYLNTTGLAIRNNIFDCTMVSMIMWTWASWDGRTSDAAGQTTPPGTTITGNSYFQKSGADADRINFFGDTTAYDYAGGTNALETAVAKFDTSPARVKWVNRADKY